MDTQHDAPAVKIARAHVEAWTNHDFHTARAGLRPDVKLTITTTQPLPQTLELNGVDDYMKGLASSARFAIPGSLRIAASTGDERNAMLMLTYLVDFGSGNEAGVRGGRMEGTVDVVRRPALPTRRQRQDRGRARDLLHDAELTGRRPGAGTVGALRGELPRLAAIGVASRSFLRAEACRGAPAARRSAVSMYLHSDHVSVAVVASRAPLPQSPSHRGDDNRGTLQDLNILAEPAELPAELGQLTAVRAGQPARIAAPGIRPAGPCLARRIGRAGILRHPARRLIIAPVLAGSPGPAVIRAPGGRKPARPLGVAQPQRVGQQPHRVRARRPHLPGF